MSEDLLKILKTLVQEIASLKKEVEELKKERSAPSTPSLSLGETRQILSRIEQIKTQQALLHRQALDEILEEAANYAIADYKKNPPRNR